MADQTDWSIYLDEPSDEDVWVNFRAKTDEVSVEGEIIRGSKGLAIRWLQIDATDPLGVGQRMLRAVPIGDVLAQARALLARHVDAPTPASEAEHCACGCRTHNGGRYMAMDDDFLRQIALAWVEEALPEKGGGVLERMAERFGRPAGTMRGWVYRARKEGWLAPATKGRLGAEPGPKLLKDAPGTAA